MLETPENLDPKEATEAKLCAYLEGEISPAEKIEIEKYLQSNPQHRKLLDDLAATRTLLRMMPKEPAPPEIAEAFEGQLERSLLLDGTKMGPRGSSSRWPQLLFAAAMVVLATGLGVVIYYTLPVNTPQKFSSIVPPKKTPAETPLADKVDTAGKIAPPNVIVDSKAAEAMNEQAKIEDGIKTAPAAVPQQPVVALAPAADEHAILPAKPVDAPAVVAVVPPKIEADKQLAMGGALDSTVKLAKAAANNTRYIVLNSDNLTSSAQTVEAALNSNHVLFETRGPTTQAANATNDKELVASSFRMARTLVASSPTTQSFGMPAEVSHNSLDQTVYIARAVSAKQADAIANDLYMNRSTDLPQNLVSPGAVPTTKDSAPLVTGFATTLPTTAPSEVLAKGDRLVVTVGELVGPGVDKTNTVKIADDGSINLPMIEPVRADGLTTTQLEQQIALKYRDANLIPSATVQVGTSNGAPATQPTTVAAAPASQPADTSDLQVVIVIQKNAPATTEPTTLPAVQK